EPLLAGARARARRLHRAFGQAGLRRGSQYRERGLAHAHRHRRSGNRRGGFRARGARDDSQLPRHPRTRGPGSAGGPAAHVHPEPRRDFRRRRARPPDRAPQAPGRARLPGWCRVARGTARRQVRVPVPLRFRQGDAARENSDSTVLRVSSNEFQGAQPLLDEYVEIEQQLADPSVHADQAKARTLGRRYAELGGIVRAYQEWQSAAADAADAAELAAEDPDFAEELPQMQQRAEEAATHLRTMLIPRDPDDGRDVILEVKAGEGGEESALFAGDLARMYLRFAERKGWGTQILDATESDLGGYKDISIAVKSKSIDDPAEGVWAQLKYEGGVHRVQR